MARVLLVDDAENLLRIAKKLLAREEPTLKTVTALSAQEALQKLTEEPFEVVVADYRMPGMDGLTLLKTLRDEGNDIPFIMFTGQGREEVAMQALNLGADYYLMKGGDSKSLYGELAHIIRRVLQHKRTKKALRESEARYRELVEKLHEGVLVEDAEEVITFVNPRTAEMLGYAEEDLLGRHWNTIVPNTEVDKIRSETAKRPWGISSTYEGTLLAQDGRAVPVIISATPLFSASGAFQGVLTVFTDITERKQAEDTLRESEQRYKIIKQMTTEGFWRVDLQGRILDVNGTLCQMLGWTRDELLELSVADIEAAENPEEVAQHITKVMEQGYDRFETRHRHKDGTLLDIEVNVSYWTGEGGEFIAFLRDITEQKSAEEVLRTSEEIYRELVEKMHEGVLVEDADSVITFVNRRAAEMLGYSKAELIDKPLSILVPESEKKKIEEEFAKRPRGLRSIYETFIRTKDHRLIPVIFSTAPLVSSTGTFRGALSVFTDITKRKQAELALQESEKRFRSLVEASFDGIAIHDESRFLDINEAGAKIFGQTPSELIGRDGLELITPVDRELAREYTLKGIEKPYEAIGKKKDGSMVYLEIVGKTCRYQGRSARIAAFRDITARKQAEKAAKARLEFEGLIANIAAEFISLSAEDIDYGITRALQSIAEFAGAVRSSLFLYSKDLKSITNTHEWCANPQDSQIELLQAIPSEAFGYYWTMLQRLENVVVNRLDDLPADATDERDWIKTHGFRPACFIPIISEGLLYGTVGVYGKIGEERDWPEEFVSLLKMVPYTFINAIERKQAEERLLQQKEELSEFAHAMAHDLKNQLLSIEGYAELLETKYDEPYAAKIGQLAQQMHTLLGRSVALADASQVIDKTAKVNLTDLFQEAAKPRSRRT
ncbi:MAG: PAS domain S-box protein [Candidatus Heimdallarchaeota archaeon]